MVLRSLIACLALLLVASPAAMQEEGVSELTFTGWSLNQRATRDVILESVTEFADANKVEVTTNAFPYNEYLNQILLQARGENLTGLVQMDVAWMAPLAAIGGLEDLTDVIPEGVYAGHLTGASAGRAGGAVGGAKKAISIVSQPGANGTR